MKKIIFLSKYIERELENGKKEKDGIDWTSVSV